LSDEADGASHLNQEKLLAVKYFRKFCLLLEGRYLSVSAEFQRTDFEFLYTIQESMMLERFLSVIYVLDLIGQFRISIGIIIGPDVLELCMS